MSSHEQIEFRKIFVGGLNINTTKGKRLKPRKFVFLFLKVRRNH